MPKTVNYPPMEMTNILHYIIFKFSLLHYLTFVMCSIISINTQGLRLDDRRHSAFNFFKRHKYDIIFVQETHWTDENKSAIEQDWDGDIIFSHGTPHACGVAILINAWLDYQLHHLKRDSHGRVLAIELTIDDTTINLVNILVPI